MPGIVMSFADEVNFEHRVQTALMQPFLQSDFVEIDGVIKQRVSAEIPGWSTLEGGVELGIIARTEGSNRYDFEGVDGASPLQEKMWAAFVKECAFGDPILRASDVLADALVVERIQQRGVLLANHGDFAGDLFPKGKYGQEVLAGCRTFKEVGGMLVEYENLFLTVVEGGRAVSVHGENVPPEDFAWWPAGVLAYANASQELRDANEDEAEGLGFVAHVPMDHRDLVSGQIWGGLTAMRNMADMHNFIHKSSELGLIVRAERGPFEDHTVAHLIYGPGFSGQLAGKEFCALAITGNDVYWRTNDGKEESFLFALNDNATRIKERWEEAATLIRGDLNVARNDAGHHAAERAVFEKRLDAALKTVEKGGTLAAEDQTILTTLAKSLKNEGSLAFGEDKNLWSKVVFWANRPAPEADVTKTAGKADRGAAR